MTCRFKSCRPHCFHNNQCRQVYLQLWRNWHTRMIQVHVHCTWVGVQVPSTALLGRGERIAFRKKSSPLFLCLQLCLKEITNLIPYLLLEEMDICMICIFNGKQRHITACLFKLIVKFFSLSKRHSMIIISMNN